MSDENKVIILLNSLPESYHEIKAAIKYGRDSLTLDVVLSALRSRELEMKKLKGKKAKVLTVRGQQEKRSPRSQSKSKSKTNSKGKRCFYCHKEDHIRRKLL